MALEPALEPVEQVPHPVLGLRLSSIQSPRVAVGLARMVRADGAPQS